MLRVESIDKDEPQYTFIFLHGLGDSSSGWTFISEKARDFKLLNNFNFLYLDSPTKKLSLQRQKAKAWYDFKSLSDVLVEEDKSNILKSYQYLVSSINEEHEKNGVDYDKIIIGGFSQGCALSLMVLNCLGIRIGGCVALGGYLPMYDYFVEHEAEREFNLETPVFVAHGKKDKVMNFEMFERTVDLLEKFGFQQVTARSYDTLGHSCNDEEITDLFQWLVNISSKDSNLFQ